MKKLFHTVHDKWHVKTFCYALLILAVHRRLLWWMQICVSYWNYIFSWNWAFSFESSLWHFWRSPRPTSHWFSLLQGDCLVKKPPDPTFLSLPEKELSGWVFVQMSHIYNNFTGWDVTDKKKKTPHWIQILDLLLSVRSAVLVRISVADRHVSLEWRAGNDIKSTILSLCPRSILLFPHWRTW